MRKAKAKWLKRATIFLGMMEKDLIGAARYRMRFKRIEKFDEAVRFAAKLAGEMATRQIKAPFSLARVLGH